jgi:TM2 domain-containing membrane protein YozV
MSKNKYKKQSKPLWLVAGILAWLIPGAGHFYIGRRVRGIILFIVINATFWTGVGIGGVMTVDSRYERWWMAAQMLTGADGIYCWYRQDKIYKDIRLDKDVERAIETRKELFRRSGQRGVANLNAISPSLTGRPDELQMVVDQKLQDKGIALVDPAGEIARGYSGIAGMLNLLCIFDALILALMGKCAEPALRSTKDSGKEPKEDSK